MVENIEGVKDVIERRESINLLMSGSGRTHSYGDEVCITVIHKWSTLGSDIDILVYNHDAKLLKCYDCLAWKGDDSDACDLASEILMTGVTGYDDFKGHFEMMSGMFKGKSLQRIPK